MIKAPEWMHEKLAAIFRPLWKWHARPNKNTERNKRIREMLEKERILKELAEADLESRITLDPGTVRQIRDTGRSIR